MNIRILYLYVGALGGYLIGTLGVFILSFVLFVVSVPFSFAIDMLPLLILSTMLNNVLPITAVILPIVGGIIGWSMSKKQKDPIPTFLVKALTTASLLIVFIGFLLIFLDDTATKQYTTEQKRVAELVPELSVQHYSQNNTATIIVEGNGGVRGVYELTIVDDYYQTPLFKEQVNYPNDIPLKRTYSSEKLAQAYQEKNIVSKQGRARVEVHFKGIWKIISVDESKNKAVMPLIPERRYSLGTLMIECNYGVCRAIGEFY